MRQCEHASHSAAAVIAQQPSQQLTTVSVIRVIRDSSDSRGIRVRISLGNHQLYTELEPFRTIQMAGEALSHEESAKKSVMLAFSWTL